MKIAVTSVSGKLGTSIARFLIGEIGKENVIGIARTPERAAHLGIEIRKGDYNSREDFEVALEGVDTVLLVSGMDAPLERIQQHRNVIAAAKSKGVKKIVYTSIVGAEENNAFSPIVQTNRQTEKDIRESDLEWVIGRNGIYIEPDLEYINTYVKEGEIRNCAEEGKCAYTSREDLGYAYTKMLLEEKHNGNTYNLVGEAITQNQLTDYINHFFATKLSFNSVSVEAYKVERIAELGSFIGTVIAGIYEGIKEGANDVPSDFEKATGRPHSSVIEMITTFKQKQKP
jgi:NAD(P)H dehydrogenase (quinone)